MSRMASFAVVQLPLLPYPSHNGRLGCVAICQTPAAQHKLLPAKRIVPSMMHRSQAYADFSSLLDEEPLLQKCHCSQGSVPKALAIVLEQGSSSMRIQSSCASSPSGQVVANHI